MCLLTHCRPTFRPVALRATGLFIRVLTQTASVVQQNPARSSMRGHLRWCRASPRPVKSWRAHDGSGNESLPVNRGYSYPCAGNCNHCAASIQPAYTLTHATVFRRVSGISILDFDRSCCLRGTAVDSILGGLLRFHRANNFLESGSYFGRPIMRIENV